MLIEIERAEAITWIRIQMAQHGLSLSDPQAAGCFAEPPPTPTPGVVRYRNAHGQGWDGRGAMPDWLQRAVGPAALVGRRSRAILKIHRLGARGDRARAILSLTEIVEWTA
ncbi:H-NS family nucleoid-associated regulatory protein [Cupriavidus sp. 2MCAB6]|uniref:hypothetical protein n=1 Tax=Cupriavidus sp. 2MCAB6 TaxID=3232981 RepID=UPI003F8F2613